MRTLALTAVSIVLLAAAEPAHATLFMSYSGIQGPVTTPGYQGDIQLDTFSTGVSRSITSSGAGAGAARDASTPVFSNASISSPTTAASVALFAESLIGAAQDVSIFLTNPGKTGNPTFAEWDFGNALISSFSTSSGGGAGEDSYALNFTKITYTWFNLDSTGKETVTFDLTEGQVTTSAVGDTAGFSFATADTDAAPEPASASLLLLAAPLLLKRRK